MIARGAMPASSHGPHAILEDVLCAGTWLWPADGQLGLSVATSANSDMGTNCKQDLHALGCTMAEAKDAGVAPGEAFRFEWSATHGPTLYVNQSLCTNPESCLLKRHEKT